MLYAKIGFVRQLLNARELASFAEFAACIWPACDLAKIVYASEPRTISIPPNSVGGFLFFSHQLHVIGADPAYRQ